MRVTKTKNKNRLKILSVGDYVELRELSYIVAENENHLAVSYNIKHILITQSNNSNPKHLSNSNKNIWVHKTRTGMFIATYS